MTNSFLNSIFESCCTEHLEKFWIDYFNKNAHLINESTIIRIIDVFLTNKSEYLQYQISLLLRILSFPEFSVECLKKLFLALKKNSFFVRDLCKNEINFNVFCKKTFSLFKMHPTDKLKPSMMYSFIKKFEDLEFENVEFYSILYKISLQAMKEGSDKFLHRSLLDFFLEKQFSISNFCKELYPTVKSN